MAKFAGGIQKNRDESTREGKLKGRRAIVKKHTLVIVGILAVALYLYYKYQSTGPTVAATGTVYGPSLAQLTGTA